jgi:hypothetical protein
LKWLKENSTASTANHIELAPTEVEITVAKTTTKMMNQHFSANSTTDEDQK